VQIALAVVADYANVATGEKLNVMGIFDTIFAKTFPTTHPLMFLAVRLQFDHEDRQQDFVIKIHLEDEDGRRLFEQAGEGHIGEVPAGEVGSANMIFGLQGLRLEGPGRYSFVVRIGAAEKARVPLRVVQLDA
jgi:hypothetical protein